MIARLLIIISVFFMFAAAPGRAANTANAMLIENDFSNVTISVSENILHVTGAAGQVLQLYNVAGVCVMTFKIEGSDKRYDLNLPKGFYIVKVGKVVRKVAIK